MHSIRKTNKQSTRRVKGKIIPLNPLPPNQPEMPQLINGLWNMAQSALWFNKHFSPKEKEQFKLLLTEHFHTGKNNKRQFIELAERICLAKRYVARKEGRYISQPQDWLNIRYSLGLAGTAIWLKQVNEVRADVPDYNKGISTLAKGILNYLEDPSLFAFYRYRRLLIEQEQYDLLQVYYNTLINLQYFN